jgi:AcrR family transcriptional regulator
MVKSNPTKRDLQKMETRQRLYNAAIELIDKKGFSHVTISDITEKAGVSKGNFYHYFKSKDEVLIEEFLKIDTFFEETLEEVSNKHRSPLKQLAAFTEASFQYFNDVGVTVVRAVYSSEVDPAMKKPKLAFPNRPVTGIIGHLVKEAQERGELRKDMSAETITEYYLQSFRGAIYEWCLQDGQFDLIKAYKRFIKLIFEGLKAQ